MATYKQFAAALQHLAGLQAIAEEVLTIDAPEALTDRLSLQRAVMDDPDVVAGMAVLAALGIDEAADYVSSCDAVAIAAKLPVSDRGAALATTATTPVQPLPPVSP